MIQTIVTASLADALLAYSGITDLLYDGGDCPACGCVDDRVASVSLFLGRDQYPPIVYTLCPACVDWLLRDETGPGRAAEPRIMAWCRKAGHLERGH